MSERGSTDDGQPMVGLNRAAAGLKEFHVRLRAQQSEHPDGWNKVADLSAYLDKTADLARELQRALAAMVAVGHGQTDPGYVAVDWEHAPAAHPPVEQAVATAFTGLDAAIDAAARLRQSAQEAGAAVQHIKYTGPSYLAEDDGKPHHEKRKIWPDQEKPPAQA